MPQVEDFYKAMAGLAGERLQKMAEQQDSSVAAAPARN
jgi:hypothetical protein